MGDAKRCTEFQGDRMRHCGLQNSRHSFSIVQEQDEQKQHEVAQLIEMFESLEHEDFKKKKSQTKKINRFSEASQELL